jgi:hypothetical protein
VVRDVLAAAVTLRAVLFGDNYPGTSSQLAGCVNDVDDVAALLAGSGFDQANVEVLRDRECTRVRMLERAVEACKATGPDDCTWIYRSGHGSYRRVSGDLTEPDNRMELHVPNDYAASGMIPDDDFAAAFRWAHPWGRIVFGVDTCHSGTAHRFAQALVDPKLEGLRSRPKLLPPEEWLGSDALAAGELDLATRVARVPSPSRTTGSAELLAGCLDTQLAADAWFRTPGGDWRANGAFTYVLLQAVKELQAHGEPFTHRHLMRQISTMLPSQDFPDQQPRRDGPGARWVVFSEDQRL